MRIFFLSITLLLSSLYCQAGYSEYQFLAPSACKAFYISTDTVPPDANSPQATTEYIAYISAKGADRPTFWGVYVAPQTAERWADCRETEKEITCTVIGQFRYPSFTCPLGESKQWSRSCTTTGGKVSELKIYSVDTREYEDGGNPIVNQYLQTDQQRFNTKCKKESVR